MLAAARRKQRCALQHQEVQTTAQAAAERQRIDAVVEAAAAVNMKMCLDLHVKPQRRCRRGDACPFFHGA